MTSGSGSSNVGESSAYGEASHDALGDTQLGRSLKDLICEIGRQKDALQKGLEAAGAQGAGSQDSDDFDPSQTRFERALELAAAAPDETAAPPDETAADGGEAAIGSSGPEEVVASGAPAGAETDPQLSQAMSGLETVLRRFAEAERRRYEQQLTEWKVQFKKATMVVIKKQVETARAKWMQNQSTSEAQIEEHYRRLKALADKVARQKAQIQQAKKELEKKLEVADRLHSEFDQIRQVLDGQIGAIDALDDDDNDADDFTAA